MAEHLFQEDGQLTGTDDGYLFINDGPETASYTPDTAFVISEAGVCTLAPVTQGGGDYSWLGAGKIALDGQPAINGRVRLEPVSEQVLVAPLLLGAMPAKAARRIRGYNLTLNTSDLSPQVLSLALSGGTVCLQADLENEAQSKALGLRIAATVSFNAAPLDPTQDEYTRIELTGSVLELPQIEQETDND